MSAPERVPAAVDPVASVAVMVPLAHLDRPFDYVVPARLAAAAQPGVRVRVRFAGRLVDGFVLARQPASEHAGRLGWLERAAGPPVLTGEVAALAREVADRYAGTLADVLRLAVPPRHAGAERAVPPGPGGWPPAAPAPQPGPGPAAQPGPGPAAQPPVALPARPAGPPVGPGTAAAAGHWGDYPGGADLLGELRRGGAPRAVWAALPGRDWVHALAEACQASVDGGRTALVVLPSLSLAEEVLLAVRRRCLSERSLLLAADLAPVERYRRFLTVLHGGADVVVGTRSAVFAPLPRLGLVALWDDGNDAHAEPHAPYPHTREVLMLRAAGQRCGLLLGGHAVSTEGQLLVASGWARGLAAPRGRVRAAGPLARVVGSDAELARDPGARAARLPSLAFGAARAALATGPVLVQVPRWGYRPGLACRRCRAPARCPACAGPLGQQGPAAPPSCRWCARPATGWVCSCGDSALRAVVVGAVRTAEELGRSFPGVPVRTSGADRVLTRVPAEPALVVATPGAEPVADPPGYAAVLLLDGWVALTRPDLRAGEEALRRWLGAAALARPGAALVVHAEAAAPAVQALVRWDPAGFAARELADRTALRFPPAVRMVAVEGDPGAVSALLADAHLPPGAEVLGPVEAPGPGSGRERVLLRVARAEGAALSGALKAALALRSARKEPGRLAVRVDPVELG